MKCKIMGILNLTEDSFFDGGRYIDENQQIKRVEQMINEGVDIVDIGAMSTKPGSFEISERDELDKITNTVRLIKGEFPELAISIDTYRTSVAAVAIELGVDIINDVSGGAFDVKILDVVAKHNIPYIMMHTSAKPSEMQNRTQYDNIIDDIISFFRAQIKTLNGKGFNNIIIDPGFGFGKTLNQNYQILANLSRFKALGYPVLVGVSRKSMIYKLLNITPSNALNGTTVVNTIALINGADYLRVHDVQEAVEARTIIDVYEGKDFF